MFQSGTFSRRANILEPDNILKRRLASRGTRLAAGQRLRKFGDVKGTIRDDLRYHFVPNDVRRHRLISVSYISLLPCHSSAPSVTLLQLGILYQLDGNG
jgi:hypothetical protein